MPGTLLIDRPNVCSHYIYSVVTVDPQAFPELDGPVDNKTISISAIWNQLGVCSSVAHVKDRMR